MDINKHISEIKNFTIKLEVEYHQELAAHELFLKDMCKRLDTYMDKDPNIDPSKIKEENIKKSEELLNYEKHLYSVNKKNLELIGHLYEVLSKKLS